MFSLTFAIGP